jgi:hypothetical protein
MCMHQWENKTKNKLTKFNSPYLSFFKQILFIVQLLRCWCIFLLNEQTRNVSKLNTIIASKCKKKFHNVGGECVCLALWVRVRTKKIRASNTHTHTHTLTHTHTHTHTDVEKNDKSPWVVPCLLQSDVVHYYARNIKNERKSRIPSLYKIPNLFFKNNN